MKGKFLLHKNEEGADSHDTMHDAAWLGEASEQHTTSLQPSLDERGVFMSNPELKKQKIALRLNLW